jgi:hypothetical protein
MKKIKLVNKFGGIKIVKAGFSWTAFFWGAWPWLFRGYVGEFFRVCGLCFITLGIYSWVNAFKGNKRYAEILLLNGYSPASPADHERLAQFAQLLAEPVNL